MIYRELLIDSRGVHIKLQPSRHRRLLFHCHPAYTTQTWEHDTNAKKTCKARARPPSFESLSGFVFRQHMGISTVFDSDEAALKKLGQITYLQRLQRHEQGPWSSYKIRPAILATSRQVYNEAAHILYQQAFSFSTPEALFDFLAALGPLPLRTIREINILAWTDKRSITSEASPAFALLPQVVNLRRLRIMCSLGHTQDWAWVNIFPPRQHEQQASACHRLPVDIVANKVYRDTMYWLRPIYAKVGICGVRDILRVHKKNFMPLFRSSMKPIPAFTPAMEDKIMERFWGMLEVLLEGDIA